MHIRKKHKRRFRRFRRYEIDENTVFCFLQILTRSFKTKVCYRAKMFVSLQCQKEDDFFAA